MDSCVAFTNTGNRCKNSTAEKELIASILDALHFLSGFAKPFDEIGYVKKYRETYFPEETKEFEGLGKINQCANGVKESLLKRINGNEIFDHNSIDRTELLQA